MVTGQDLEYQTRQILDSISRNIDQAAILIFAQQLLVCLRPDHTVEESFFLASIQTLINLNRPRIDGFSGGTMMGLPNDLPPSGLPYRFTASPSTWSTTTRNIYTYDTSTPYQWVLDLAKN